MPRTRALELYVRQQANTWFLFALAAVALYLSYLVAQPFLNAIFAAVVLAVVFHPLHIRIYTFVARSNLAATLSTVLVILMVAIPATVLAAVVTRELGDLYRALSERSAAQGGLSAYFVKLLESPIRVLGRYVDGSHLDVRSTLLGWVDAAGRYLVAASGRAVGNVLWLLLETVWCSSRYFFSFVTECRFSGVSRLCFRLHQSNQNDLSPASAKPLWPVYMAGSQSGLLKDC